MCFTSLKKPRIRKVRFISKTCYKIVTPNLSPSMQHGPPYEMGKRTNAKKVENDIVKDIVTFELIKDRWSNNYSIYEGIHSYKKQPPEINSYYKLIKCIIPIGALYCKNRRDYVSTAIIPIEIIKDSIIDLDH